MTINIYVMPIVALITGIVILLRPQLTPYIVAVYLIVTGILGIVGGKL